MSNITGLVFQSLITLKDFFSVMSSSFKLGGNIHIAVAVSGGSDSMCLTLLLHQWAKKHGATITALIVNHKLRKNIKEEIKQVCGWLSSYNINTHVLTINAINPNSKVQENARIERYKTLIDFCKKNNIYYLAVAHHFNDLIETVNMRKKRPITLWGLSGMSIVKDFKEVLLIRPLLFFSKVAIKNTLCKYKQKWVEDPSNKNLNFERVITRKSIGALDKNMLCNYISEINQSREKRIKLEEECILFLVNYCVITNLGVIKVNLAAFLMLTRNLQVAVLRTLIQFINSKSYMVKINKINSLLEKLVVNINLNKYKKFTLGGAVLFINHMADPKTGNAERAYLNTLYLNIVKEARSIDSKIYVSMAKDNKLHWDERFLIHNVNKFNHNNFFANLSSNEYNLLYKIKGFKEIFKSNGLNKEIILSLPWLFNGSQPSCSWLLKLLDSKHVSFSPSQCLFKELFYNFSIAK